jgi:FAD:protein FMN transferase
MGTIAELKVVRRAGTDAEALLDAAMARLSQVEEETTSYRADAVLVRMAEGKPTELSADADAILSQALDVAGETDGMFDPTAGALVHAWGFPEHAHLPDSTAVDEARARVGRQRLRRTGERIWTAEPGTEADLGGIAKGWGVDAAADELAGTGGACLVNVGGDLAVRGTKPGGAPWRIGVQDPRDPSRLFVTLALSGNRAVATSGDYQRYVDVDGVRYHHLLDPRTGWPARGVHSATVIAPTCALADAWATAAFVMGAEAGLAALEREPELEGVLVGIDADGALVLHETPGFAAYRSE